MRTYFNFVNQDFRVTPARGSIAIFPSNFVYSHIGEVPKSGDKYITVSFASVDVGDKNKYKENEHEYNDREL